MDKMEQKIKLELLQELIEEMGGSAVESKVGKKDKEPVAHVTEVEEKIVPLDKVKDLIKEKLSGEGESAPETPEVIEESGEEDSEESSFMKRLKAAKAQKAC